MISSTFNDHNLTRRRNETKSNNVFTPCILSFILAVVFLSIQNHSLSGKNSIVSSSTSGGGSRKNADFSNLKKKTTTVNSPTSSSSRSSDENTNRNVVVARNPKENNSVFNCGGINGRCVYFYATKFFHPENGVGKEYRHILEHIESLRRQRQLWPKMPRIGFPTFSFNENVINPRTNQPFHRHNVTFIHVHKAGGTSIHNYAASLQRRTGFLITRHPLYQWNEKGTEEKQRTQLAYHHLSTAGKYKENPEDWGRDDHVMFAFLRDPLERFISSIGQAMGAQGSQRNIVGEEFQSKCINGTVYSLQNSRDTLQCCIDYIQEKGYYFEVHMTPQAAEIAFATQMYHIPVAIFKFEESYSTVLTELGADPDIKHRDGDAAGYRPNPVLTGMTSADYTPELIQQICKLYRVDVIMHRSLGWDVPRCKEYV